MGGGELELRLGSEGGSEEEKRKGLAAPGMFSESRHAAWRDWVTPEHVVRLSEESRQVAWRDQKGYFLQI
jgi:hypothetical protein